MSYSVSLIVPFRHDDGGHREDNWFWCWRWWNEYGPNNIEICVSDDGDNEPFNRSRARNKAVEKATGDILVIADADTLPDQTPLTQAIIHVANGAMPWCIPYRWYYNLSREYTESLYELPRPKRIHTSDTGFNYEHKILSFAGILVVPRKAFYDIGGYDERFEGWGHEDVAFRIKLDAEYGKHNRVDGNAYHLWHPIAEKDMFNSPQELKNRRLFKTEYAQKYNWKDERVSGDH